LHKPYFDGGSAGEVIRYTAIDRVGLHTEVVSAKNEIDFIDYLRNHGFAIPEKAKPLYHDYINKDYSFVISWIADLPKFINEKNLIGVKMRFPAEKIFFPLKPTAIYGDKKIPILLYIMQYVDPALFPEIANDSLIQYFETVAQVPADSASLFNGYKQKPVNKDIIFSNVQYSKIKIESAWNSQRVDSLSILH
jgi:hypothetical protein